MLAPDLVDFERIAHEEAPQADRLAQWFTTFQVPSVLDVGSGPGTYVHALQRHGIRAIGVDNDLRAPSDTVMIDLRTSYNLPFGFSAVLCLEVLEHIEERYGPRIVRQLTQTAPLIVFSAARPGQGGEGHINCQERSYWIKLFQDYGFPVDELVTRHLLHWMRSGPHMGWLLQNVFVARSPHA